MPPSPGHRLQRDRMKESILKESSAGWASPVSPLRIAKRETSTTSGDPQTGLQQPGKVVARRTSNSYRHMFTNNLVSKSPFKAGNTSAQATRPFPRVPTTLASGSNGVNITPKPTRRVSGEKRVRPDSLIQQAELENTERARKLGFQRRQSQAFQNLVQREPVSKSPFRKVEGVDVEDDYPPPVPSRNVTNSRVEDEVMKSSLRNMQSPPTSLVEMQQPISISFPTYRPKNDGDTASYESTTDSYVEEELHRGFKPQEPTSPPPPAPKPATPTKQVASPLYSRHRTPSPSGGRRSPLPSALQASPARSSLANKSRLMGPRSRSASMSAPGSPADTPGRRERRKTVTFDERCDVMEFDRESHEDVVFDQDDDFYGARNHNSRDDSLDSDSPSSVRSNPPMNYPEQRQPFTVNTYDAGNDSINGLVDSMLAEASAREPEPHTPESKNQSLPFDEDLRVGGDENGVPHGRTHHSERTRMHQLHSGDRSCSFDEHDYGEAECRDEDDELSFSSIMRSTPQKTASPFPDESGERSNPHTPSSVKAPDAEDMEDGVPLGRTHHSDRSRLAHMQAADASVDREVQMLPPSPSPGRPTAPRLSREHEATESLIPKFDIGLNDRSLSLEQSNSMHQQSDDPFDMSEILNHSLLSKTSVASFHELPPQSPGPDASFDTSYEQSLEQSMEVDEHIDEHNHNHSHNGLVTGTPAPVLNSFSAEEEILPEPPSKNHIELDVSTIASSQAQGLGSGPQYEDPYQPNYGLVSPISRHPQLAPSTSYSSLRSNGSAPRESADDIRRRLSEIQTGRGSPIPPGLHTPSPRGSPIQSGFRGREPLEERLRKALSPTPIGTPSLSGSPNGVAKTSTPIRTPLHLPSEVLPSPTQATHSPVRRDSEGPERPVSQSFCPPGVDIADMRSALDRLVEDVKTNAAASHDQANMSGISQVTSEGDISMAETELLSNEGCPADVAMYASLPEPQFEPQPQHIERAATAPIIPLPSSFSETPLTDLPTSLGDSSPPPPVPAKPKNGKTARQEREEIIKEKRRLARARDSGEFVPPRRDAGGNLMEASPKAKKLIGMGKPSRRRSMSTGDAEDLLSTGAGAQRRVSALKDQLGGVLGVSLEDVTEAPLTDSIERELKNMDRNKGKSYQIRELDNTIYASSSNEESVSHMDDVGDLNGGKAWRTVKRPSDMNEYAQQLKDLRSQEKYKGIGKVFVKVVRLKGLNLPLPVQNTAFTCTLNNGIHFVSTPEARLSRDSRIEQEFELIEHSKLEFTLTLKVRRDPHIVAQFKALAPLPLPARTPTPTNRSGGVFSIFSGSPKKLKHNRTPTESFSAPPMEENLARYLKPDGTLARAFVSFKDVAKHCDTKLFETTFPLIGQKLETASTTETGRGSIAQTTVPKQIGEIVLQMFRLPPLPGIPPNDLPQSLEECHKGLRSVNWHKVTYHEGVLTQLGGDCSTWRRRQLRVIGGNLVAFNDVTKRAMATIDLKKAIAVEDDDLNNEDGSGKQRRHRDIDDFDAMYGVERSFRLIFPRGQEITFFADSDEEKTRWLEVLRALVGHIPPNPLWAEVLWQRQQEAVKNPPPHQSTSVSASQASHHSHAHARASASHGGGQMSASGSGSGGGPSRAYERLRGQYQR